MGEERVVYPTGLNPLRTFGSTTILFTGHRSIRGLVLKDWAGDATARGANHSSQTVPPSPGGGLGWDVYDECLFIGCRYYGYTSRYMS